MALTSVLGGPAVTAAGYGFVLSPVALGSLLLTTAALAFNNATRRSYPHSQHASVAHLRLTSDERPTERIGVSKGDLDAVLQERDELLDISRGDLKELVLEVEMRAYRRRFEPITCADIMSRNVVTVRHDAPLRAAWLLRQHDIRALLVVDEARQVIGLISDFDLLVMAARDEAEGSNAWFLRLIRRSGSLHAARPKVVGQVMRRGIRTVTQDRHPVELVPLLADAGLRHVVVADERGKLGGIISQADLIAALYRGRLEGVRSRADKRAA